MSHKRERKRERRDVSREETSDDPLQPTYPVEGRRRLCRRLRDRISGHRSAPRPHKIKIGHLTPLTGFLGAIGSYAQLGMKMAAEEINASGGIMGKQIDLMSEDSVNPATASTKAQRMLEQDGAVRADRRNHLRPRR